MRPQPSERSRELPVSFVRSFPVSRTERKDDAELVITDTHGWRFIVELDVPLSISSAQSEVKKTYPGRRCEVVTAHIRPTSYLFTSLATIDFPFLPMRSFETKWVALLFVDGDQDLNISYRVLVPWSMAHLAVHKNSASLGIGIME